MRIRRPILVLAGLALLAAACSGEADPTDVQAVPPVGEDAAPTAEPEVPPTLEPDVPPVVAEDEPPPAETEPGNAGADVLFLADDALAGRDNGTQGSTQAREYIVSQISAFAEPLGTGQGTQFEYEQEFDSGINVLGVIPGSDLADQYVVVGAHYDHLGTSCSTADDADAICNGATDNATGVAAVIQIGRMIDQSGVAPRRSVLLAFWDSEEDGLLGSNHYVTNPTAPIEDTVVYVNFDIVGANLLPSLRDTTFAIGAETGGAALQAVVDQAIDTAPLPAAQLSAIFGQGRSDYQNFISAQVPTVFFSDATGPCYHTAQDEFGVVDFAKLEQQIVVAHEVVVELANMDAPPMFASGAPVATFADAAVLDALNEASLADLGRFEPDQQEALRQNRDVVAQIVAAGEADFGGEAVGALLGGTAQVINLLTNGQCDGFFRGY